MTSPKPEVASQAPLWLLHPARVIAGAYGLGFVVVNIHLARYAEPASDLLKARYLAAGLVYALTIGIPALSAALGWTLAVNANKPDPTTGKRTWTWEKRRRVTATVILAQIGTYVLWTFQFLSSITIKHNVGGEIAMFLLATIWGVNGVWIFGDYVREFHDKKTSLSWWNNLFTQTLFAFVALLGTLGSFAKDVYPNVAPQYGGGAVAAVRVQVIPSADSTVKAAVRFPVGPVERSNGMTFLLSCDSVPRHYPRSVAIASESITAIDFVPVDSVRASSMRGNLLVALSPNACDDLRALRTAPR